MKKILFILYLLVIIPAIAYSQSSFARRYVAQAANLVPFIDVDTCDNGFIVLGNWADPALGSTAFTLLRTDSLGMPMWSYYYQTPAVTAVMATQIATGQDGFFVVGQPGFVTKLDFSGNIIWSVVTDCGAGVLTGIAATPDSGCIAVAPGMLIMKYDKHGNIMWNKAYATIDGAGIKLNGNGYLIYGRKGIMPNSYSPFLAAIDSMGNMLWYDEFHIFGSVPYPVVFGEDVASTTDGGYVLSTMGYGCIKVDHNGLLKWGYRYHSINVSEYRQVSSTSDNGVILVTGTPFAPGATPHLIKIDSTGAVVRDKMILSNDIGPVAAMHDAGPGKYVLVTSAWVSATQNTLVTFDSSLVYPCTDSLVTASAQSLSITIVSTPHPYPFSFQGALFPLNKLSLGQVTYDACTEQWLSAGQDKNEKEQIKIFPNPFSESTTIEIANTGNRGFQFELYDINGQIIRSVFNSGSKMILDREDIPAGIYFYRVFSEKAELGKGKLVVE